MLAIMWAIPSMGWVYMAISYSMVKGGGGGGGLVLPFLLVLLAF